MIMYDSMILYFYEKIDISFCFVFVRALFLFCSGWLSGFCGILVSFFVAFGGCCAINTPSTPAARRIGVSNRAVSPLTPRPLSQFLSVAISKAHLKSTFQLVVVFLTCHDFLTLNPLLKTTTTLTLNPC